MGNSCCVSFDKLSPSRLYLFDDIGKADGGWRPDCIDFRRNRPLINRAGVGGGGGGGGGIEIKHVPAAIELQCRTSFKWRQVMEHIA